ncbi:MAG: hypothetical protein JWO69_917 [Thermoleophilia bacterium]|nr:hypothetical protein [Thermoleophilia bacterium]
MGDGSPLARTRPYLLVLTLWAAGSGGLAAADLLDPPTGSGRSAASARIMLDVGATKLLRAPTAKDLAGQVHGIQGYLPRNQQLVQVPVSLTNASDDAVEYDPRWFRLLGKPGLRPSTSTLQPGVLPAGTTIDGTVGFIANRDGRRLTLEFDAPHQPAARVGLGGSGRVVTTAEPRPHEGTKHDR